MINKLPQLRLLNPTCTCVSQIRSGLNNDTDLPPPTSICPLRVDISGAAVPTKGSDVGKIPGPAKCLKEVTIRSLCVMCVYVCVCVCVCVCAMCCNTWIGVVHKARKQGTLDLIGF